MFIDPHVHTKEISLCSQMTLAEMVDLKRSLGYDGVVLTNHCQPWYYEKPAYKSFIERFIAAYREGKK
ncbi:MAG: PHP domain-containing protein [Clostridia bacterium]|nr:PHP domain-containing protein [Clostridia bacterium]